MESIVGAVNGIHIQIKRPVHYEEVFLNQREYHSLFVQVSSKWFMVSDVFFFLNSFLMFKGICDAHCKFLAVDATKPGSTHKSRVLKESSVGKDFAEHKYGEGFLIGDREYPCTSYMLTPFSNPSNDDEVGVLAVPISSRRCKENGIKLLLTVSNLSFLTNTSNDSLRNIQKKYGAWLKGECFPQERYNFALKSTKCTIDHAFRILEKRFSCLRGKIRMDPGKVSQWVRILFGFVLFCFVLFFFSLPASCRAQPNDCGLRTRPGSRWRVASSTTSPWTGTSRSRKWRAPSRASNHRAQVSSRRTWSSRPRVSFSWDRSGGTPTSTLTFPIDRSESSIAIKTKAFLYIEGTRSLLSVEMNPTCCCPRIETVNSRKSEDVILQDLPRLGWIWNLFRIWSIFVDEQSSF